MKSLNGWQRAWVVLAVLWSIPVLAIAFEDSDTILGRHNGLSYQWLLEANDAAEKSGEEIWTAQLEGAGLVKFPKSVSQEEASRRLTAETLRYRRELQSNAIKLYLGFWLIPPFAAYALGWSVGWVMRGFRSKQP